MVCEWLFRRIMFILCQSMRNSCVLLMSAVLIFGNLVSVCTIIENVG